jgi:hypothetical protein
VLLVGFHSLGEKNGKNAGRMLSIVVIDVEKINLKFWFMKR